MDNITFVYHHAHIYYAVVCSSPSYPSNGYASVTSTYVGSTARYFCNSGYTLSGLSTRVCQSSHSWSGQQPSCIRKYNTVLSHTCVYILNSNTVLQVSALHYDHQVMVLWVWTTIVLMAELHTHVTMVMHRHLVHRPCPVHAPEMVPGLDLLPLVRVSHT